LRPGGPAEKRLLTTKDAKYTKDEARVNARRQTLLSLLSFVVQIQVLRIKEVMPRSAAESSWRPALSRANTAGSLCYSHFVEGAYARTEAEIRRLLGSKS
jgi:hypothetical protein